MRLLNCKNFKFEECFGSSIPDYATLSHTWVSGQEISFREAEILIEANGSLALSPWTASCEVQGTQRKDRSAGDSGMLSKGAKRRIRIRLDRHMLHLGMSLSTTLHCQRGGICHHICSAYNSTPCPAKDDKTRIIHQL